MKKVSLVIPVFNEEACLEELYKEIVGSLNGMDYELIFIDDGSTDGTFEKLRNLSINEKRIKVIRFRKNFGQTAAIAAGFKISCGGIIVTMDADLQNDPKDIPRLIDVLEGGYDVVSGWRKNRMDSFILRRVPSFLANKLISAVTGLRLHDYGCTLKAYRSEIVKDIHLYGEMHRFLPALASWIGCRIAEIEVAHHPRTSGKSKYNITRTFKVLLDLLTVKFLMSYSTKPNYVFGGAGIFSFFTACIIFAVVTYRVFVLKRLEATPLVFIMTILFVAAIQLILMGLLAEMLIRSHFEAQDKSTYFIKEEINT